MLIKNPRTSGAKTALFCVAAALLCAVFSASSALAHGVEIEQSRGEAVEIVAAYDTGEPMSEGQVSVYSPEDPEEPWATGTTDEEGRYVFMPDESQPGTWIVQVREAGHGANAAVEIGESEEEVSEEETSSESSGEETSSTGSDEEANEAGVAPERTSSVGGNSPLQTGLMAALGLWGFIGTALYFRGRGS